MKFIDVNPHKPFAQIGIENNKGEQIRWNTSYYCQSQNINTEEVFSHVNDFLATLSKQQQEGLFKTYSKIRNAFDNFVESRMLYRELTKLVGELYSYFSYDQLCYYIDLYANIQIPTAVKERYEQLEIYECNVEEFEKTTYLREDYQQLIHLCVYLRFMVPIWAEYAAFVGGGNNILKEYQMLGLISQSEVFNYINKTTGEVGKLSVYEKLFGFTYKNVEKFLMEQPKDETKDPKMSAALGGLSVEEFPNYFVSGIIVRKLPIVKLDSNNDRNNIVTVIYSHIDNTLKRQGGRSFYSNVKAKDRPSDNDFDESSDKSILETYRMTQDLNDGDTLVMSIYTEDPFIMARSLGFDLDLEQLYEKIHVCQEVSKNWVSNQFTSGQLNLLRWCVSPVLSPRALENTRKEGLISYLICSQAVLWQRGHYDIAKIITAKPYIGGTEPNRRITREQRQILDRLYPYASEQTDKSRERSPQANLAILAIERVVQNLSQYSWLQLVPEQLKQMGTQANYGDVIDVPVDIRLQLANWVIELEQLNQKRTNIEYV